MIASPKITEVLKTLFVGVWKEQTEHVVERHKQAQKTLASLNALMRAKDLKLRNNSYHGFCGLYTPSTLMRLSEFLLAISGYLCEGEIDISCSCVQG